MTEKKSFIKSLVSEVRVIGTEVLLAYNFPFSRDKLSHETVGVPPIVHYGGPFGTVPELIFEKRQFIPALQQLLITSSYLTE